MVVARLLARQHRVTVFEAGNYVGGHTHTVPVTVDGRTYGVDTGFIVYNEATYPGFCALLDELGIATRRTSMSFSVRLDRLGLEYASQSLNTLFAQRRNLLSPSFISMLRAIPRFNADAKAFIRDGDEHTTIGDLFRRNTYPQLLAEAYLIPMMAAIWSADPATILDLPARHFYRFFNNHGLLNITDRPAWRVLEGGSSSYIEPMTAPYSDRIRINTPVERLIRKGDHVEVVALGHREQFDEVVLACHSNEALAMLHDATDPEREILGAMAYQPNDVVLHTDTALLPRTQRAWASWNYHIADTSSPLPTLTYNMNILQGIDAPETFCVTLNQTDAIDPARILGRYRYSHPVYTADAVAAQQRHSEISGRNRTHFCGAYWGYGFHEDGVQSALRVAAAFGEAL